jgi:hypothetical protein
MPIIVLNLLLAESQPGGKSSVNVLLNAHCQNPQTGFLSLSLAIFLFSYAMKRQAGTRLARWLCAGSEASRRRRWPTGGAATWPSRVRSACAHPGAWHDGSPISTAKSRTRYNRTNGRLLSCRSVLAAIRSEIGLALSLTNGATRLGGAELSFTLARRSGSSFHLALLWCAGNQPAVQVHNFGRCNGTFVNGTQRLLSTNRACAVLQKIPLDHQNTGEQMPLCSVAEDRGSIADLLRKVEVTRAPHHPQIVSAGAVLHFREAKPWRSMEIGRMRRADHYGFSGCFLLPLGRRCKLSW